MAQSIGMPLGLFLQMKGHERELALEENIKSENELSDNMVVMEFFWILPDNGLPEEYSYQSLKEKLKKSKGTVIVTLK